MWRGFFCTAVWLPLTIAQVSLLKSWTKFCFWEKTPLWQILIWAGTRFSLLSCESFVCLKECILPGFLTVFVNKVWVINYTVQCTLIKSVSVRPNLLRIESVLIEVNNSTVLIYLLLIRVLNSGSFFNPWNQNQEVSARKAEFIAIRILDTCWPLSASGRMVSLFPYTIFEYGLLIDR